MMDRTYPDDLYVGASKIIELARQEARALNASYVGTEHLLLAVVNDASAANVLQYLGVDPREVRLSVERLIQGGADCLWMRTLPLTPRSRKVIESSMSEALDLNHNYLATEHVLLGMLREQETVAAQIFTNLGVKLRDVREVVSKLGDSPQERLLAKSRSCIGPRILSRMAKRTGLSPDAL